MSNPMQLPMTSQFQTFYDPSIRGNITVGQVLLGQPIPGAYNQIIPVQTIQDSYVSGYVQNGGMVARYTPFAGGPVTETALSNPYSVNFETGTQEVFDVIGDGSTPAPAGEVDLPPEYAATLDSNGNPIEEYTPQTGVVNVREQAILQALNNQTGDQALAYNDQSAYSYSAAPSQYASTASPNQTIAQQPILAPAERSLPEPIQGNLTFMGPDHLGPAPVYGPDPAPSSAPQTSDTVSTQAGVSSQANTIPQSQAPTSNASNTPAPQPTFDTRTSQGFKAFAASLKESILKSMRK